MNGDLHGRTIVITGASSGIGLAAARQLAGRGATVVPVGRDREDISAVAAELGTPPVYADFASLDQVRALAHTLLEHHPRIDVLVHNAGATYPERLESQDGHELTWQVNYLAPFLLQSLLHERLRESNTHTVVTSSLGHWFGQIDLSDLDRRRRRYSDFRVYCTTKLALILFTREIARQTPRTGITAAAFHPGVVGSAFGPRARGAFGIPYRTRLGRASTLSPEEGAEPLIHLASLDDPQTVNGQYFNRSRADARTSAPASDAELARKLWVTTEVILAKD